MVLQTAIYKENALLTLQNIRYEYHYFEGA